MSQYKISTPIRIRYLELNKSSGITDLKLIAQPPVGSELPPIAMIEVDNQGIYEASFTPDAIGNWWLRIKSDTRPLNVYSKSYYVGENTPLIRLWDGDNNANINTSGRLLVSQEPPTPPIGMTGVVITSYSWVATEDDDIYVIPNGENLKLQRVSASGGDSSYIAVTELWYDPLGTGIGMTIIDVIFSFASDSQHDLAESYIGDGIKAIRMRRRSTDNKPIEIFGRWEGYY